MILPWGGQGGCRHGVPGAVGSPEGAFVWDEGDVFLDLPMGHVQFHLLRQARCQQHHMVSGGAGHRFPIGLCPCPQSHLCIEDTEGCVGIEVARQNGCGQKSVLGVPALSPHHERRLRPR